MARRVAFATLAALAACTPTAAAGGDSRGKRMGGAGTGVGGGDSCTQPAMRPAPSARTFVSPAVDALIASYTPKFKDPNLATLFSNTLPNSLDTTIYRHVPPGAPGGQPCDSFIVTGDITAMWLRDSSNQVAPYVPLLAQDPALRGLFIGLIQRQARSVLLDPYANAFQLDALQGPSPHADDETYLTLFAGTVVSAMTPSIFERKWEVDSLANVLRLSAAYYTATGDTTPFNATWVAAVATILDTFQIQRRDSAQEDAAGGPPYVFQRTTDEPSDSLEHGRGYPVRYTGLIKGGFRGSDDACVYSYNIPENAFASVALREVAPLLAAVGQAELASAASALSGQLVQALQAHGTMQHPTAGRVWAYEVDGFGNAIFMDDANIPSLLSMPLFNFTSPTDPLYLATRAAVLSPANPWWFNGTAGAGVGGPHNGSPYVWPMAIIAQAATATTDAEIEAALATLISASACTGLTHESFNANNVQDFTRPWFAWANSLFGGLIMKLAEERPYIIFG